MESSDDTIVSLNVSCHFLWLKNLEYRVRFELTVFRICNPMQWAALPPIHELIALQTPVVIIPHQKFGQQVFTHQLVFHHTRLPPTSRRVPFSHCQRPFGLKTTTRTCHCTSHPAGHSIRRHPKRLGERQVAGSSAFCKGSIQAICLSYLADSIGFEPMRHFRNDGLANRSLNHSGNYP